MNVTDNSSMAYYAFNEWLFGWGTFMPLISRDEALRYWLNELGGLAGVWQGFDLAFKQAAQAACALGHV